MDGWMDGCTDGCIDSPCSTGLCLLRFPRSRCLKTARNCPEAPPKMERRNKFYADKNVDLERGFTVKNQLEV